MNFHMGFDVGKLGQDLSIKRYERTEYRKGLIVALSFVKWKDILFFSEGLIELCTLQRVDGNPRLEIWGC